MTGFHRGRSRRVYPLPKTNFTKGEVTHRPRTLEQRCSVHSAADDLARRTAGAEGLLIAVTLSPFAISTDGRTLVITDHGVDDNQKNRRFSLWQR